MQSSASGLIVLDIVLYLFAIYLSSRGRKQNNVPLFFAYLAVLFFCLFAAWGGDYYHYIDYFDLIKGGYQVSLEPVYYSLIYYLKTPFQFRIIVWGGALLVFYLSSRRVDVDKSFPLFCLALCFLPRFSYARVSLAMSIMTFGCVIIGKKDRFCLMSSAMGVLFVVLSLYFHKSAFWGVLMISLAVFFYDKVSLKSIILLSFLAPIIIYIATIVLSRVMTLDIGADDTILYAGQRYLSGTYVAGTRGWGQIIEETLMRLSFYFVAILFIIIVKRKYYYKMPRQIKILSCTSFFTIILASVFAFDLGFSTHVIYNRFLYYAQLPSAFFIAYCLQNKIATKWLRVVLYTGSFAALYALVYSLYCSFF